MKCRKGCCLFIGLMIFLMVTVPVQAQELPVTVRLEYIDSEEQILVSIIASEPAVWEAYTLSVVFDNDVYKLHKGYDKLPNGYGYSREFQENQGNAMMLSNALDNKVIFSGVRNSQENSVYAGVIAQAVLLKYRDSQDVASEIWLEISALQVNGENIALTDKQVFYNGTLEFVKENNLQTGVSDRVISEENSSQPPVSVGTSESSALQDSEVSDENINNTDDGEINDTEVIKTEDIRNPSTILSPTVTREAVSENRISKTVSVKTAEKDQNQGKKSIKTGLKVVETVLVVCLLSGIVVLINKKEKRSD